MEINFYVESKMLSERIYYQINKGANCYNETIYWRVIDSATIELCVPNRGCPFFDDISLRFEKDFPEYSINQREVKVNPSSNLVIFEFTIKRYDYKYVSQEDLYNMFDNHNGYCHILNPYYT